MCWGQKFNPFYIGPYPERACGNCPYGIYSGFTRCGWDGGNGPFGTTFCDANGCPSDGCCGSAYGPCCDPNCGSCCGRSCGPCGSSWFSHCCSPRCSPCCSPRCSHSRRSRDRAHCCVMCCSGLDYCGESRCCYPCC
nr:keratin-associated protein 5-9 [Drosophila kikkawai]